jgi:hypothetical protein
VYHVELRQFPHATRSFNLSREELDARILRPWVAGQMLDLDEREWSPEKARLMIVEGPVLAPSDIGLGRGWASAVRAGEDVTERLLAEARSTLTPTTEDALPAFKGDLRALAAPMTLAELVARAGERYPQWRVSERLALVERAVWELLHEGALSLRRDGDEVGREQWGATLLAWESWSASSVSVMG